MTGNFDVNVFSNRCMALIFEYSKLKLILLSCCCLLLMHCLYVQIPWFSLNALLFCHAAEEIAADT